MRAVVGHDQTGDQVAQARGCYFVFAVVAVFVGVWFVKYKRLLEVLMTKGTKTETKKD